MPTPLADLVGRYDASLPLAEASTPPAAWYTDPRIAELERRTVFARTWQFAGRLDQLRQPGDYVTCEIAGEPILMVHGAIENGRIFEELGVPAFDPAHDRAMLCGSTPMLNDTKALLEATGLTEGSNAKPAEFVIERAFVG